MPRKRQACDLTPSARPPTKGGPRQGVPADRCPPGAAPLGRRRRGGLSAGRGGTPPCRQASGRPRRRGDPAQEPQGGRAQRSATRPIPNIPNPKHKHARTHAHARARTPTNETHTSATKTQTAALTRGELAHDGARRVRRGLAHGRAGVPKGRQQQRQRVDGVRLKGAAQLLTQALERHEAALWGGWGWVGFCKRVSVCCVGKGRLWGRGRPSMRLRLGECAPGGMRGLVSPLVTAAASG
jgi:hypothetical protein